MRYSPLLSQMLGQRHGPADTRTADGQTDGFDVRGEGASDSSRSAEPTDELKEVASLPLLTSAKLTDVCLSWFKIMAGCGLG